MCLSRFFQENGIQHETSCIYTSQLNGRVERKHRHIRKYKHKFVKFCFIGCSILVWLPRLFHVLSDKITVRCQKIYILEKIFKINHIIKYDMRYWVSISRCSDNIFIQNNSHTVRIYFCIVNLIVIHNCRL